MALSAASARRNRRAAVPGSVWTPSPSMKVRYQSSRLSRLQIASPPSAWPDACAASSRSTAAASMMPRWRAARVEQHVARDVAPRAAHPDAERHRESHLLARQDLARQDLAHRLAQDPLRREPAQLHARRQRRGELDELVIEEGHAALDRGRHAHLVLLHQQLDEIRLQVRVEQPIEHRAAAVRRVEVRARRAVGAAQASPARRTRGDEQRAPAAAGRSPRSCRRTSPRASAASPGTSAARSGRDAPAAAGTTRVGDPRAERRRHGAVRGAGAPVGEGARILAVAGEQLVAAFAGQHDLDVLARQRRHEVQRHARGMRDRLVLVPDQPRQRAEEVLVVDDDLVRVAPIAVATWRA